MGKNVIQLTESELINLVRRVVSENQAANMVTREELSDYELEEGVFGDKIKSKFSWVMDAANEAARLFKNEYMDQIPEEELENLSMEANQLLPNKGDVKTGLIDLDSEEGEAALAEAKRRLPSSRIIAEGLLTENALKKATNLLTRLGILGGIGIAGTGMISFASQVMGYIDSEFLTRVHEIVQGFGCGIYCGPLSFLVVILGILIAFGSAVVRSSRGIKESRRYNRNYNNLSKRNSNKRYYR